MPEPELDPAARAEYAIHCLFQSILDVTELLRNPATRQYMLNNYNDLELELAHSELFRAVMYVRSQGDEKAA